MEKMLTIAIPTYNRPTQLRFALDEIISQRRELEDFDEVQIVVVDNASTTHDIYALLAPEILSNEIKVYRNLSNLGIDGNVKRCLQESRSNFVWLLSDDDLLSVGALRQVQNYLRAHNELGTVLANYTIYNEDLDEYIKGPIIESSERCREGMLANLTYISSTIINIKKLRELGALEQFDRYLGSLYYHMAIAIKAGAESGFSLIPGSQIKFRSGCSDLGGTVKAALDPFKIFKQIYCAEKEVFRKAKPFFFWENVWPLIKHFKRTGQLNVLKIQEIKEEYGEARYLMLMHTINIAPLALIKKIQGILKG